MKYDWKDAGEEWSEPWGNSAAQWQHAILPRIRDSLPAQVGLEIGAGFGRWSHYLREECTQLWLVDHAPECVAACARRFADDGRVRVVQNDGHSLPMVADGCVDFVFSFDSLVHVAPPILEWYMAEIRRILANGGTAFLHHSNLGAYADSVVTHLPAAARKVLRKLKLLDWEHRRNAQTSAEMVRAACAATGLWCVRQELVNWRGRRLIDCFTWIKRSEPAAETVVVWNPRFMREAAAIRRRALASPSTQASR